MSLKKTTEAFRKSWITRPWDVKTVVIVTVAFLTVVLCASIVASVFGKHTVKPAMYDIKWINDSVDTLNVELEGPVPVLNLISAHFDSLIKTTVHFDTVTFLQENKKVFFKLSKLFLL